MLQLASHYIILSLKKISVLRSQQCTRVALLHSVCLEVFREAMAAHELLVALRAFKTLLVRVSLFVTLQII